MAAKVRDDYWNLVHRLPLVPIRNKAHLHEASRMVTELATRVDKLRDDEREYFSVLVDLMAAYEKAHKSVRREKMTPAEALKALLD